MAEREPRGVLGAGAGSDVGQRQSEAEEERGSRQIGIEDLGSHWRIDVQRVWIGTRMEESFSACALKRLENGRWRRMGKQVVNDGGPIQAISDLLSVIDLGILE